MKLNKKGQTVAGLQGVIWTLVILGIMLVIGLVVLDKMEEASWVSTAGTGGSNETLTTVTETGEDFTDSTLRNAACTLGIVTNATGGETIAAGNYTQTNCNLASAAGGGYNNTNWNVTYTSQYDADTVASLAGNATIGAIADIPEWLPVIVVVVIAAVILGLVYFFRQSGGGL